MKKFIAKNHWVSYLIIAAWLLLLLLRFFVLDKLNVVLEVILFFFVVLYALLLPTSTANMLLYKASLKMDNECDPTALLLETAEQLAYRKSKMFRPNIIISSAAALICLGRYSEAKDRLAEIDPELCEGISLETKTVYYQNLCCAHLYLGDVQNAELCHSKAAKIASYIKNKKNKEALFGGLRFCGAEIAFEKGNLDTAVELLRTVGDKCRRMSVEKAFLFGKIFLKKDMLTEAAVNFAYAAEQGNILYSAHCARENLALQSN